MNNEINENVLCVLRLDKLKNKFDIDYVKIETSFKSTLLKFSSICNNVSSSLEDIRNFIATNADFNELNGHYRYCEELDGAYQSFNADNEKIIKEIPQRYELMLSFYEKSPIENDIKRAVVLYKQELREKYWLWAKAYSINKAYRMCHDDKSVLTFSHRIAGWSNPVCQLTPNFSIEVKTNFGYGKASYFYVKLRYKNIEINPFSDWMNYEFAKFSEIIRYTKSYSVDNLCWLEAMEFTKDACNLSIMDENAFVEKYIIDECEKMASSLESALMEERFVFKDKHNNRYPINKEGHVLVEFRGEKVSGALDFMDKITAFTGIVSIKSFTDRIEICNKKMQPILIKEAELLQVKLVNLAEQKEKLKPEYDKILYKNNDYNRMKVELQKQMVNDGQLNIMNLDARKLESEFNARNVDYKAFQEEYVKITTAYYILTGQINNLFKARGNIISYNDKIVKYFI